MPAALLPAYTCASMLAGSHTELYWTGLHVTVQRHVLTHLMCAQQVLLPAQQCALFRRRNEDTRGPAAERAELAPSCEAQRQPLKLPGSCGRLRQVQIAQTEAQQRVHCLRTHRTLLAARRVEGMLCHRQLMHPLQRCSSRVLAAGCACSVLEA